MFEYSFIRYSTRVYSCNVLKQVDAKDPSSRTPRDSMTISRLIPNVTYALKMQAETGAGIGPLTETTFVKTNPLGTTRVFFPLVCTHICSVEMFILVE